jgi:RND family efflux transporter MFP subunit
MATVRQEIQVNVHVEFDVDPDKEYPATFQESTAQADPVTQTFQITYTMPQPKNLVVLPGMTAQLVATAATADLEQFVIPAQAVFADEAGVSQVWIVDPANNTVSKRVVEVDTVTGADGIVVTNGLEVGDMIAVAAVHRLREGEQVRPVSGGRDILQ